MKKLICSVITAAVICCAAGLSGCDLFTVTVKHVHEYNTAWTFNSTYHWHECKNSDCPEKIIDKAEHVDADGNGRCDVCQYDLTSNSQSGNESDGSSTDNSSANNPSDNGTTTVTPPSAGGSTENTPSGGTSDNTTSGGSTDNTTSGGSTTEPPSTGSPSTDPNEVTSVSLNKYSITLTLGSHDTIVANVSPSTATDKTITWSSSAPTVVSVSNSGTVTALSVGTANITATSSNGKRAVCAVTVNNASGEVDSVSLNKTSLTLGLGESETLIATVSPATATNKTVTWSTSNNTIVKVDSNGTVTGVGGGTATITVKTANNKTSYCAVTVSDPTLTNYTKNLAYTAIVENGQTVGYSVSGIGTANTTNVIIPTTYNDKPVTSIAMNAFKGETSLKSVTIPYGVTSIGESAFAACGLTSVKISNSVTTIGDSAFYMNLSLTEIVIPDSVKTIGSRAFSSCGSLTKATIGSGVTTIGASAFQDCNKMTTIIVGKGLKTVDSYAFAYCSLISAVYYCGSSSDWSAVSVNTGDNANVYFTSHVKYFSETSSEGCWHYGADGKTPVLW